MKRLMVIAFILYAGIGGAQRLSKKSVDRQTGNTTQRSRMWTLYNPPSQLFLNDGVSIAWRIEKISAKARRGDTTLLYLWIRPVSAFQLTSDSSLLQIYFAGGGQLSLQASSLWKYPNEVEIPASGYIQGNADLVAKYPLTAAAIHLLITAPVIAIRFHTTKGPGRFAIDEANAHRLQKKLSALNRNSEL